MKQKLLHLFHKTRILLRKENLKELLSKDFWWHLIKKHKKLILWAIGLFIALMILIPIVTYIYFAGDLKDKQSFTNRSRTGLTLMDDEGKTFFTFYHAKEVTYIPLSDIPKSAQQAVIASEDQDFYENPGFSITGIGRAFVRNLLAGRIVEGGSTISQELVKIGLLNSERTYFRKYQELVLATELNRRFSKDDILEMYLNSVYFGEGAFGIENAAQIYFGVHAKDLSLAQTSMLIGLLPAPSAYSPISGSVEKAERRQEIVLSQMTKLKFITDDQAKQAEQHKLRYNQTPPEETNVLAPHFAIYVRDLLIKQYGEERIIREGFQVKTTLHRPWQEYAEQVVKTQVSYLTRNHATNGAVVAIDPNTGDIKVMVGSHDWEDESNGKINMTVRPRQPGSSFKPLIYADALEKKEITPATTLHDDPIAYGDYKPLDYDKKFRGPVTVRYALANSLNIPAVEVLNKIGVSEGLSFAKKFGITTLTRSPSDYGLSLVLGSGEVPLIEMTDAYAVFADQGKYHPTNAILEIKNKYGDDITNESGNLLTDFFNLFNVSRLISQEPTQETRTVMTDETAYLISSILSDNKARSDVFGGLLTISRPAAVKTGTTNDYKDSLTIGYTPSLVIGVWVGNNDNTPMDNVAGSTGAAPIWRLLMESFLRGTPLEPFIQPPGVLKVDPCLTRPTNPKVASVSAEEYYLRGTEPEKCPTPTPSPTPEPTDTPTPTTIPTATPKPTNTPVPTAVSSPTPTNPLTPTGIVPTVSVTVTPLPTP